MSLTLKQVEEAHSLGIKVFAWTPDSEGDMLRLMKMKVDAIVTNRPDILSKVLQRNPLFLLRK